MLRGQPPQHDSCSPAPDPKGSGRSAFPGVEEPYAIGERPPGILFYCGRSSFWLPYHLLQGMRYEPEALKLTFAPAEVIIEGRGLHGLYVDLAQQVVWRVVEQGDRYAEASDATVHINRIVEIPKGKDEDRESRQDVRTSEHDHGANR